MCIVPAVVWRHGRWSPLRGTAAPKAWQGVIHSQPGLTKAPPTPPTFLYTFPFPRHILSYYLPSPSAAEIRLSFLWLSYLLFILFLEEADYEARHLFNSHSDHRSSCFSSNIGIRSSCHCDRSVERHHPRRERRSDRECRSNSSKPRHQSHLHGDIGFIGI